MQKIGDKSVVEDDTRLEAGLDTLDLCLQYAQSVTVMGHIGRPGGRAVAELSVRPVAEWFEEKFSHILLPKGKLHILENLRFEPGEESCDPDYAKELASLGDFFVNESFAAHHPAASTTVLPTLLPHAAGLRFAREVSVLTRVRNNPKRPLTAVIGGAKLEDKLKVLNTFARVADHCLVAGKLSQEIRQKNFNFPTNVVVAGMNQDGTDLSDTDSESFKSVILGSKQVVWAGPVGRYEDEKTMAGTMALAQAVIASGADSIVGGGDTITALNKLGLLSQIGFVSVGGGAMLELLATGTLPTIEVLK